jgi:hypothetical protein
MIDDLNATITDAWVEAGRRLGVRVVAPHQIGTETYLAYLPDFGGPTGMVIAPLKSPAEGNADGVAEAGLYLSRVSEAYASDDLDLFRATLNDWGWYGSDASRPAWYSGKSWTS